MQSTPNLDQFIPESLTKLAYQGFQEGKKVFGFVHKSVSDRLTNTIIPEQASKSQPLSAEVFEKLQVKLKALQTAILIMKMTITILENMSSIKLNSFMSQLNFTGLISHLSF